MFTPQIKCPKCNGTGQIECIHCEGTGGEFDNPDPETCKDQWFHCETCQGEGTVSCTKCDGNSKGV